MGDKHNKGKASGAFKGEKKLSEYKLAQMGRSQGPVNPADSIGMNPKHRR